MNQMFIHVLSEVQQQGDLLLILFWCSVRGEGVHFVTEIIVLACSVQRKQDRHINNTALAKSSILVSIENITKINHQTGLTEEITSLQ